MKNESTNESVVKKESKSGGFDKFLKVFGLVSLIVTTIGGIIFIYSYLFQPSPDLIVSVYESRLYFPPNMKKLATAKIEVGPLDNFRKALKENKKIEADYLDHPPGNWWPILTSNAELASVEKKLYFSRMMMITQHVSVFIHNRGDKEAKDINISFPSGTSGFYRVDGTKKGEKEFEQTIKIDSSRPGVMINIDVWLVAKIIKEGDLSVTVPSGEIPVNYFAFQSPIKPWYEYFAIEIIFVESALILLLVLAVIGILQSRDSDKNGQNSGEESTSKSES